VHLLFQQFNPNDWEGRAKMKKDRKPTPHRSKHPMGWPLYLDLKEFQALSGLPYRSLEKLVATGRLPHIVVGKSRLIHRTELLRIHILVNQFPKNQKSKQKEVKNDDQ
jgi:hypothetical protein